jgi:hypothetical protein
VFMSIQGQVPSGVAVPPPQTRTFKWLSVPALWEDSPQGEFDNLFVVLAFPNASWALLIVSPST